MEVSAEGKGPTIALDPESSDYAAHWDAHTRELRGKCPVAWSGEHGGFWVVTRYADILSIAQQDAEFTNGKTFDPATGHVEGGVALPPMKIGRLIPAEVDREEWELFRGLLNPRFGPRAAESYRERARSYAEALLDRVIERGKMDLVQDFTSPLTALVTMTLVGFPLSEWR